MRTTHANHLTNMSLRAALWLITLVAQAYHWATSRAIISIQHQQENLKAQSSVANTDRIRQLAVHGYPMDS